MSHSPQALVALLCVSVLPAPLFAQSSFEARSGYGTADLQVATVPFSRFLPFNSSGTFSNVCCNPFGGRWPTGGIPTLAADFDASLIPNGASLEDVAFYVLDNDGMVDHEFRGYLCRNWVDLDGGNPSGDCPVSIETAGAPGDAVISAGPALTVRYQFDVDGDPGEEVVNYTLVTTFGISGASVYDGSIRLRAVRLLYRRQVSPAPSAPTFGDVPTSHPFFQFIEALADSGITVGCGAGNFCPDSPLTRGQMAVFLAKALGLHWPGPVLPPT